MPPLKQAAPRGRLARFNEIAQILIRNDAWAMVRTMSGRDRHDPDEEAALTLPEDKPVEPAPVRLRRVLEELGPSFIKIGQLLATRPDLVSQEYVDEFKKLYDATAPSPFEEVRHVIERELGKSIEEVFATFEGQAIASASIGQVHRATLKDGTAVAVKVQHAGIEEAMALDFQILEGLVKFVERTFAASRLWQPTQHLAELRLMLERELDYRYEMKNSLRVRENFRNDANVHIPRMFPELCAKRVLVMEFVQGVKFTRMDHPAMAGVDRKAVARAVTHAMGKQIFIHRLFHADPSPGNMLILPPDKVAFLDFGAVGIVTERRAKAILQLITSISRGDVEGTADAVMDLCDQRGEVDVKRFTNDIERILDFFEREDVSVADPRLMEMLVGIARDHKMFLPADFVLISRALFQFEGFCRELDPEFELVDAMDPLVGELLWTNLSSPKKQKELVEETVGELLKFGRTLPHTLNTLIRKVERNEISTRVEVAGMEGLKRAQGRGVLKTSFTIMMAALVIGLGLVYASPDPVPRAGRFLFAAGSVVAVWTLVMVLWSEAFKGNRE